MIVGVQVLVAGSVARWRLSALVEVLSWYYSVAVRTRLKLSAHSLNGRPEMTTYITSSLTWRAWRLSVKRWKCVADDSGLSTYLSTMLVCHHSTSLVVVVKAHDTRTRNSYEKLVRVNSREKLVRVSSRLAARYFSREFLASNRACSISCKFLVRVFVASFSYKFLVRLSWA